MKSGGKDSSHMPSIADFSQYKVWLLNSLDKIRELIRAN